MPLATKNIDLNIRRPGVDGVGDEIVFTSSAAAKDLLRIPRRYPFADIANYTALKAAGYFRHATLDVSSWGGATKDADKEAKLGYALPQTEKLILLVRRTGVADTGTAKQSFIIHGSTEYGIEDQTIEFAADAEFVSGTKIYEVDLYNLGLYICGVDGEDGLIIENTTGDLEFALIARTM
jgi:hypothetical protein